MSRQANQSGGERGLRAQDGVMLWLAHPLRASTHRIDIPSALRIALLQTTRTGHGSRLWPTVGRWVRVRVGLGQD